MSKVRQWANGWNRHTERLGQGSNAKDIYAGDKKRERVFETMKFIICIEHQIGLMGYQELVLTMFVKCY